MEGDSHKEEALAPSPKPYPYHPKWYYPFCNQSFIHFFHSPPYSPNNFPHCFSIRTPTCLSQSHTHLNSMPKLIIQPQIL